MDDILKREKITGLIITLVAAIAFGVYPAATQKVYADGANVVFVIIFSTFIRANSLFFSSLLRGKKVLPEKGMWIAAISGGLLQAVSICGVLASLQYLPAPITIIVLFTHTIMLLFLMAYKREIKLTKFALVTTLTALFGISLVVDVWQGLHDLSLIGLALVLVAAVATTVRLYGFGKQLKFLDPAVVGAQTFSIAFFFILFLAFFSAPVMPNSGAGYLWVLIASLGSALGTFGMFYGIKLLGAFQFSLMIKTEPIFTALFSFLILGQTLEAHQYLGMVVVLVSLVAYQKFGQVPLEEGIELEG